MFAPMETKQIKTETRGRKKGEPTKPYFRRIPESSYSDMEQKLDAFIKKNLTKNKKKK